MDLQKETEIVLRDGGYETWPWQKGLVPAVCFEDELILGFVHYFASTDDLVSKWEDAQSTALLRFRPALRNAGEKAWNVYSIFITVDVADDSMTSKLDSIEENFEQTRKLVRTGVISTANLKNALLPLLPIQNRPQINESNMEERLRVTLQEINPAAAKAFLGKATPIDIAQILAEK